MKEKLELSKSSDRERIVKYLRQGKIGLFPTDTVYGICCRMDNERSVERIFNIKKRDQNKPFLILGSGFDFISKYIYLDRDKIKKDIIDKYWPGPLTVVFKSRKENVPDIVNSFKDTIAVRIPDYEYLREVISNLGVPIVAPSANISGLDAPSEYGLVDERIINAVDFVVLGECKMGKPSTIIDCSGGPVTLIREGAVSIKL